MHHSDDYSVRCGYVSHHLSHDGTIQFCRSLQSRVMMPVSIVLFFDRTRWYLLSNTSCFCLVGSVWAWCFVDCISFLLFWRLPFPRAVCNFCVSCELGYGIGINALCTNIVDLVSTVDEKTSVTRLLKRALLIDLECTYTVALWKKKTFWLIAVGS